jgi:hypothetical protein
MNRNHSERDAAHGDVFADATGVNHGIALRGLEGWSIQKNVLKYQRARTAVAADVSAPMSPSLQSFLAPALQRVGHGIAPYSRERSSSSTASTAVTMSRARHSVLVINCVWDGRSDCAQVPFSLSYALPMGITSPWESPRTGEDATGAEISRVLSLLVIACPNRYPVTHITDDIGSVLPGRPAEYRRSA